MSLRAVQYPSSRSISLSLSLAETAIHSAQGIGALFEPDWPRSTSMASTESGQSLSPMDSVVTGLVVPPTADALVPPATALQHPSAVELYARICQSNKLDPGPFQADVNIGMRMKQALDNGKGSEIRAIVSDWGLTATELEHEGGTDSTGQMTPGWRMRVEQLQLLSTLLAVGTGRIGQPLRIDFFLVSREREPASWYACA